MNKLLLNIGYLAMATLIVAGCGSRTPSFQPAGVPTNQVTPFPGLPTVDSVVEENVVGSEPSQVTAAPGETVLAPDGCQPESTGYDLFVDPFPQSGTAYCFLYPEGFEVLPPSVPGYVHLIGPAHGQGPEPARASATITTFDPAGLPLDQFVEQAIEQAAMGLMVNRQMGALGLAPAWVIEGLPGQVGTRVVYAEFEGLIYYLQFAPIEPTLAEAQADMERLYQAVMTSWSFLPAQ